MVITGTRPIRGGELVDRKRGPARRKSPGKGSTRATPIERESATPARRGADLCEFLISERRIGLRQAAV
jgi:hypothetical protein